jgi:hypothetical protein
MEPSASLLDLDLAGMLVANFLQSKSEGTQNYVHRGCKPRQENQN